MLFITEQRQPPRKGVVTSLTKLSLSGCRSGFRYNTLKDLTNLQAPRLKREKCCFPELRASFNIFMNIMYPFFKSRYKKELTVAMERESSLERSRAQLEVDWQ